MPFPLTPIIESGVGADQSPITGWTDGPDGGTYGGIRRVSNQMAPVSTDSWDYYSASGIFRFNCEVYTTLATWTTGIVSLDLRVNTPGSAVFDSYEVTLDPALGQLTVSRNVNNTYVALGAVISQTVAVGDSFGLQAIGSTLYVWYKVGAGAWTLIGTRTDSVLTNGGYVAIYIADAATRLTGFGGGSIPLPVGLALPAMMGSMISRRRRR